MATVKLESQDAGRPFLPPCRVCGDQAAGFHYGVNTCEACKGFFHRSLRRYKEYKCRANRTSGYCEYKPGKRKSCQYCRYQRCLHAGMSKDAIKTGRYTYLKRTEDTREIKRLQDLNKLLTSGELENVVSSVSSTLSSPTSTDCGVIAELYEDNSRSNSYMEVDSTTKDEFDSFAISGSNPSSSCCDLSSPEAMSPSSYLIIDGRNLNTVAVSGNNTEYTETGPGVVKATSPSSCSDQKGCSQSKSSIHGHVIRTNQSPASSKFGVSVSPPCSLSQNTGLPYTIKVASSSGVTGSRAASQQLAELLKSGNRNRDSVIYRLLTTERSDKTAFTGELAKDYEQNEAESQKAERPVASIPGTSTCTTLTHLQRSALSTKQPTNQTSTELTTSPSSSSSSSHLTASINVQTSSCFSKKDLPDTAFDLFPDISFCMDGQPLSSPAASLASETGVSSVASSVAGSHLSVRSQFQDSDACLVSSPGAIVLNLDSGQRLKVGEDDKKDNMEVDIDPDSSEQKLAVNSIDDDSVTLQIMEEYTQGFTEIRADRDVTSQAVTTVQTLLTSPSTASPSELRSTSPLPSPEFNEDYLPEIPSPTSVTVNTAASDLQPEEIPELYSDKEAVIKALLASHKENIGDFSFMPKDEMIAQQKAHYEACKLKNQTFGNLGLLPEKEYDDIYSLTGMDVDGRRRILQKYLSRMERCVRGLVQFAKSIPGFSNLDINHQVALIKLSRSEFAMFTTYPTANLELGVCLGLCGERWACEYDIGKIGMHQAVGEYMRIYCRFCDKLQKLNPNREEVVLLKAILVVSTDRDSTVNSPLADAIRWQLFLCLIHSIKKHRDQPAISLARYILAITQSRSVAEAFKDFLRHLKIDKYSSIEQNPLMWEMYSSIFQDKEKVKEGEKAAEGQDQADALEVEFWSPSFLSLLDKT